MEYLGFPPRRSCHLFSYDYANIGYYASNRSADRIRDELLRRCRFALQTNTPLRIHVVSSSP